MSEIPLHLNGEAKIVDAAGDDILLDTLRDCFGLTSVRGTCRIGICGTCSVQVDGRVVSSCLLPTRKVERREVVTSEGLVGADGRLGEVQEAFVRSGAYQCSFCIPAMVVSIHTYRDERIERADDGGPPLDYDEADLKEYLAGNLCRCGTYPQIIEAAHSLLSKDSP